MGQHERARVGSELQKVFAEAAQVLEQVCARFGLDPETNERIVGDVLSAAILKHHETVDLGMWLVRCVTLSCAQVRRARKRSEAQAFDAELLDLLESGSGQFKGEVEAVIRKMGERCRESLLARYGFASGASPAIGPRGARSCVRMLMRSLVAEASEA